MILDYANTIRNQNAGEFYVMGQLLNQYDPATDSFAMANTREAMVDFLKAAAGLNPWPLVVYGTIGNVMGSLFNYFIGTLGRLDWIEKYLHVKPDKLDRAQRLMAQYGVWIGFFAFLPIIGSAIAIVLGLVRANIWVTLFSFTLGKIFRYLLIIYGMNLIL